MKKFSLLVLVLSLVAATSCKYGSQTPFDKNNSVQSRIETIKILTDADTGITESDWATWGDEFSFLILTDIHIGSLRSNSDDLPLQDFYDFLENLDSLGNKKPKFCFFLGDDIDYGDEKLIPEYEDFKSKIEAKGLKIFNVVGNHDLYQNGYDIWCKNNFPGTSFYKYAVNGVSFYCLDSGSGSFGSKQSKILKTQMEADPNLKLVFTHYPLYTNMFAVSLDDPTERNLMINLFNRNNVIGYFNGHIHRKEETDCGLFIDYSVPSFRYRQSWTIITVNKANRTVSETVYKGSK